MNLKRNRIILIAGLLTLLCSPLIAQVDKSVVVVVNTRESSWPDGTFPDQLNSRIAEFNGVELANAQLARELMERSEGKFNKEDAIEHGIATENRFVIWCDIKREEMRTEKGFSFPFLAKQRRVTAYLEIEYRIVDCFRSRLVASDRIKAKQHGPSTLQCLDFTDADPNLYLSYNERKDLFEKLEQKVADKLTETFAELTRQR